MLKFVFGRNYAGKTGYVRQLVADRINGGEEDFIIIVPEQFSYATEKSMLEKVGTNGMLKLEVLSFSRLAELVFEAAGKKNNKPPVDDGVRILTMSLALESMSDKLNIFRKYVSRPQLTSSLFSFATDLKQCTLTPDMLS
jgi:ATP-dependent helicase/nuclease subunit B